MLEIRVLGMNLGHHAFKVLKRIKIRRLKKTRHD
jgi:hypothetical protein